MSDPVTKVVTVDKAVAVGISPVAAFVAAPPVLQLTADADVVGLACRVDGGAFAPCASPWAPVLADGARTVEVRATDDVGNVATAARTFVVDSTAPALALTDAPAEGAVLAGGATSITVQQLEANPGTLACSVDGTPVGCAPGAPVSLSDLAGGAHTFVATATDQAGNVAALVRHFTVQAPAAPTPVTPVTPVTPAAPGADGGHAAAPTRAGLRGPARAAAGARVRFQVTVSAPSGSSLVPAGPVTWTVDGKRVCKTPLRDGKASCRTARLAPGRHVVVASYAGSDDFTAATVRTVVVARR
nr:Ig-like domain-containing protein [Nocardioides sp. MAH-18]